jgi:L-lactate permease
LISIASPVLPALLITIISYELPTILDGLIGLVITGVCVNYKIGFASNANFDGDIELNANVNRKKSWWNVEMTRA